MILVSPLGDLNGVRASGSFLNARDSSSSFAKCDKTSDSRLSHAATELTRSGAVCSRCTP